MTKKELEFKIKQLKNEIKYIEKYFLKTEVSKHQNLPVPRLELSYEPTGRSPEKKWSTYDVKYRIIYRHLEETVYAVPLGLTQCDSGYNNQDGIPVLLGKIRLPFRFNAQIKHDMKHLNLPGYAILEDQIDEILEFEKGEK